MKRAHVSAAVVQHAITFLPPTACNYFIVHDAEIKFLLLLSNAAAACRRYNLKIQIALPPHQLCIGYTNCDWATRAPLSQNCYIVLIILYTDLELHATQKNESERRIC